MSPAERYDAAVERLTKAREAFYVAQNEYTYALQEKRAAEREYLRERFPTNDDLKAHFASGGRSR